jgi:hypothetical protein
MRGVCARCGKAFQYERVPGGRRRTVCPGCQRANMQAHNRRRGERIMSLPTEEQTEDLTKDGLTGLSREDAAWRLGISTKSVEYAERSALAKIRQHPEAKELFRLWKSDGTPIPGPQREVGEVLLEWQIEAAAWRAKAERLLQRGLSEEAEEMRQLIEEFQGEMGKVMGKLTAETR